MSDKLFTAAVFGGAAYAGVRLSLMVDFGKPKEADDFDFRPLVGAMAGALAASFLVKAK